MNCFTDIQTTKLIILKNIYVPTKQRGKNYEEQTLKWSTNCHLQKKFTQFDFLLKFGQIHGWNGHVHYWKILDHIMLTNIWTLIQHVC